MVRPLINATLPKGVIKELRHSANESVRRMITQWRVEAKPTAEDLTTNDLPARIGEHTVGDTTTANSRNSTNAERALIRQSGLRLTCLC